MFKSICYEICYDSQCVVKYILTNSLKIKTALCAIYMFAYNFKLS